MNRGEKSSTRIHLAGSSTGPIRSRHEVGPHADPHLHGGEELPAERSGAVIQTDPLPRWETACHPVTRRSTLTAPQKRAATDLDRKQSLSPWKLWEEE